jgi:hypothetical protein
MWKTNSTICGEVLPQYVEEKFHSIWKSEVYGTLQLISRLFIVSGRGNCNYHIRGEMKLDI